MVERGVLAGGLGDSVTRRRRDPGYLASRLGAVLRLGVNS